MDGHRLSYFLILFLFVAVGCGAPVSSSKNTNVPAVNPNFGSDPLNPDSDDEPSEAAGMFLRITSDTAVVTNHRADVQYQDGAFNRQDAGTTNFTTDCRILSSATGDDRDIFCIAEVEELDLFFSSMKLQFHVPPSMCSYARFMPYHFWAYEAGAGPASTSHEVLADGSVNDVLNTLNGVPQCDYKYEDGPNCCTGDYTRTITTYASDGTFDVVSTEDSWGGNPATCLSGPALSNQWRAYIGADGFPMARLDYVVGTGANNTFTIDAAINSTFNSSQVMRNNLWAANFYNPSDHPSGSGPGYVAAGVDGDRPVALRIPDTVSGTDIYMPEDSYILSCLDRADEVLARIRLMIRDWNQNPIASGGDPDTTGTDPGFPDDSLNDRLDWLDIGAVYPTSYL
jgi:hypothetical protein